MAMDPEFKRQTEELIEKTFEMYKGAEAAPRISDVWQCERVGDFLCGFFVGELVGSALGAFQVVHRREPTGEEHMEIVAMIERRAPEIREFFSKFN